MAPTNLLQSCSSVHRVFERNEIYTLVCSKTFFGCRVPFSPANLPEPLHAIVGADMSSFRARGGWTRVIVDTWKQVVTQMFLRKILHANHQKDRWSDSGSIQTNNILAFPPFLPLARSSVRNINMPEFPNQNLPLLYLLSPYLQCSSSTSITTRMNSKWWVCLKWMSLDLLRRLCINSRWSGIQPYNHMSVLCEEIFVLRETCTCPAIMCR
jgi:hypothetical protein